MKPAEHGPRLLLAGHLPGETPILVYRVGDFDGALKWRVAHIDRRFRFRMALRGLWYLPQGGQSGGEDMEFKSGERARVPAAA